jgi:hypothetical protein
MFTNTLDAIKGWFHEAALDHSAARSAVVQQDNAGATLEFKQGTACSLDADGNLLIGVAGTDVAIFLLNSEDDPDVANISFGGDHSHTASGDWIAIGPSGQLSGLVATGGYELETTQYKNGAYAPGDTLDCPIAGQGTAAAHADAGMLQAADSYVDAIVGVVSKKQTTDGVKNSHGQLVLRFWSVWLPAGRAAMV